MISNNCNNFSVGGFLPKEKTDGTHHICAMRMMRCTFHFSGYTSFHRKIITAIHFSDRPQKYLTNLVEDVEIFLPAKFRRIPFSGFRGEVDNVSANQRRVVILFFRSIPKIGTGCWDILFSGFWEVENVKSYGRTTVQRMITIMHLSH